MKNKISLILAIVAIVGMGAGLYWQYGKLLKCGDSQVCAPDSMPANSVGMSVVTVEQSDSFYDIRAEYPQFDSADATFNKKIADTVNGLVDVFQKEAKNNFDARNATMPPGQPVLQNPAEPFDFIAAVTPAQYSPDYESFMIDVYYFSGGAHGIDQILAFNYDLKNKKEITIVDFLGSADNLAKLAQMAQSQVAAQVQSSGLQLNDSLKQMIADGTAATAGNYRNFTFGYGKLTVYFEQYQVAPGSAGTIKIDFYKNDLEQNGINTNFIN